MAAVTTAALLGIGAGSSAHAAEQRVTQLVTAEMVAQIAPVLGRQLDEAFALMADRPAEALDLLAPLQERVRRGELNYWEAFEVLYLVGEAQRLQGAHREARLALEECLKFTDVDSERRSRALVAAGKVYAQLKDTDRALAVFGELNGMRGGRDPEALTLMALVHSRILGDRAGALPYLEAAAQYETGAAKHGRYAALRMAYVLNGQLEQALAVAKAMVAEFDDEADRQSMDEIVAAMNRRAR